MVDSIHLWAILLAGGEGSRVRSLTRNGNGTPVPKQFFKVPGRESMLRWTVRRAGRLVPRDRIVAVVAEDHRCWWGSELLDIPENNVVVQPENRGTAAGILLPFLEIVKRDRDARILVLPCDHYVQDEEALHRGIVESVDAADRLKSRVVLLGMVPRKVEVDCGWIVSDGDLGTGSVRGVSQFVEKPAEIAVRRLVRQGAVVNSLIFAATAAALMGLFDTAVPHVVGSFMSWRHVDGNHDPSWARRALYEGLAPCDFSREVLQRCPELLAVLPVRDTGWMDLGTPSRLTSYLQQRPGATDMPSSQACAN